MTFRSIMLIAAALLMAVGTVLVARGWIESQRNQQTATPAAPAPVNAPFVLVADRSLPLGSFIKQGQLRWQAWPDDELPDSYLVKGKVEKEILDNLYNGTVVRRSITAGEPITQDRLIRPGDRGFLAAVLQAGFRAVSIPISAASGIAGLIFPGDRVDIILTHTLQEVEGETATDRRASETVLTNVRVLALDQKVNDQNDQPKLAKTATLEVTPKQAEIIAVVRELGSLSFALRSIVKDEDELERLVELQQLPEDADPEKGTTYTWDSEASLLVSGHRGAEAKATVTVVRGKETQQMSFGNTQ